MRVAPLIVAVFLALSCSYCAAQTVNFTASSYPPCVTAFTISRLALMYGIPDARLVVVSAVGCNVTFYIVDANGSERSDFISAAALNYYFSTLQTYALQNITFVQSLSFVGPAPTPPPPLPSSIPTPVPVALQTFVATFDSAVACASFPGKIVAYLQILPSRIRFATDPTIACPAQAILQFSFVKRINGDVVTIADIVFALNGLISSSSHVVTNVLGAKSLASSSTLPDPSLFAVGNASAAVFTAATASFSSIAEYMKATFAPSSFALLWLTDQNETTFSCIDESFLSCVYPNWQQGPASGSNGKNFPLLWICCGLTLFGFAVTCVVVSKRPREAVAVPQADLAEKLKPDSPTREEEVINHREFLPSVRTGQKSEFDME